MTALAQARAEQARLGEFLRTHAAWRDSDEMVETAYGRMRARTAYAGAWNGMQDWLLEECLILREGGLDRA